MLTEPCPGVSTQIQPLDLRGAAGTAYASQFYAELADLLFQVLQILSARSAERLRRECRLRRAPKLLTTWTAPLAMGRDEQEHRPSLRTGALRHLGVPGRWRRTATGRYQIPMTTTTGPIADIGGPCSRACNSYAITITSYRRFAMRLDAYGLHCANLAV